MRAERPGDRDIFCDIEPSLSALVLRDERLRSPQLHCKLALRDPGLLPGLDQAGRASLIVERRGKGSSMGAAGWELATQ